MIQAQISLQGIHWPKETQVSEVPGGHGTVLELSTILLKKTSIVSLRDKSQRDVSRCVFTQWNRIEDPDMKSHNYNQPTFDKGCWENWLTVCKTLKLGESRKYSGINRYRQRLSQWNPSSSATKR
jgi:hypothetical protein